jgi:hypothetical protein
MIQPRDRHSFPSVTAPKNASSDPAIPASGPALATALAASLTGFGDCWMGAWAACASASVANGPFHFTRSRENCGLAPLP